MTIPPPPAHGGIDELLARCATEPIHIPGSIQSHGVLLVVDGEGVVTCVSANLVDLVPDVTFGVGSHLTEGLGASLSVLLVAAPRGEPLTVEIGGRPVDVVTHDAGPGVMIEIEHPSPVDLSGGRGLLPGLQSLQAATTRADLLDRIVVSVREITTFDRVMVYEFDSAWNGAVVAEATQLGQEPFLGLRYPASDIPPQARELYLRNRVRLIPDVAGVPVPIIASNDAPPIDLSDSSLRGVSPVHLEYLTNMGVAASASIALIVHGRLWGLIACHHYSGPLRPSQRIRAALDIFAGTAAALLSAHLASEQALQERSLLARLDELTAPFQGEELGDPIAEILSESLADLLGADGVIITARGRRHENVGLAMGSDHVSLIVSWLEETGLDTFCSSALGHDAPAGLRPVLAPWAAGLLAVQWGTGGEWIIWFRHELVRSIRWGGDPMTKRIVADPAGDRLGPRRSFAEYVVTIEGTSLPWMVAEISTGQQLGQRLASALTRHARRDRAVAAVMQRTLLLDVVPPIPGADVGIVYRPAGSSGLGGDWHDVYFLPDGRAVIAVGDVAGHGLDAAASMAQLRNALRAYVVRESTLGEAVTRLNDLSRSLLPGEMTTLVIAILDPVARSIDVLNAGHLPPVIRTEAGVRLASWPPHPAIGVIAKAEYRSTTLALGSTDAVVFYSDGLVERRQIDLDDQLQRLVDFVSTGGWQSSRSACEALFNQFAPDGSDDTTVLVMQLSDRVPLASRLG